MRVVLRSGVDRVGAVPPQNLVDRTIIDDLRVFCPKVATLARLMCRKSQHFVTRLSFGLSTREDARASNADREKACRIDRSCAMQTAFGRTFDIAHVKYASKRKNEQRACDR